jgi:ribosomal protein L28
MFICNRCGKGKNTVNFSRHKKGSSGAGGTWALRAPIHKRIQKPNLHAFKGEQYCTKCLRVIKKSIQVQKPVEPQSAPVNSALV